jgi:hypothetical protein
MKVKLSGFSREYDYRYYWQAPKGMPYYKVSALKADLPAFINAYTLQRGFPSPRDRVTAPSPHRPTW